MQVYVPRRPKVELEMRSLSDFRQTASDFRQRLHTNRLTSLFHVPSLTLPHQTRIEAGGV